MFVSEEEKFYLLSKGFITVQKYIITLNETTNLAVITIGNQGQSIMLEHFNGLYPNRSLLSNNLIKTIISNYKQYQFICRDNFLLTSTFYLFLLLYFSL